MTDHYIKQFHLDKDVANNAASKLSPEAEASLKAAHDPKASAEGFSHAIVKGETHPLGDTGFTAKLEAEAKKEADEAKAKEDAEKAKIPPLSEE